MSNKIYGLIVLSILSFSARAEVFFNFSLPIGPPSQYYEQPIYPQPYYDSYYQPNYNYYGYVPPTPIVTYQAWPNYGHGGHHHHHHHHHHHDHHHYR